MNHTPSRARQALAAAALTCVAASVAACSSSPAGSPAPVRTITVTASPAAVAATAAPTPVPASSPAVPAGPGPCPAHSLQVKRSLSQGTAGSVYTAIDFTNISKVTCTLFGYPGVSLAGGKPVTQIGQAAVENPATPRVLVTVQPGVTGNALLQIVDAGNYPASRCGPVTAHYLQIYPPNQTTPVYIRYRAEACAKPVHLLTVSVVKPGSGG